MLLLPSPPKFVVPPNCPEGSSNKTEAGTAPSDTEKVWSVVSFQFLDEACQSLNTTPLPGAPPGSEPPWEAVP
jgi:hypothetical protein